MCWAEKCCYCIPLRLACIILGVYNLITSITFIIISLVCYFKEVNVGHELTKHQPYVDAPHLGLYLKMETVNIILGVLLIVSVFWMIFSALLIVGVLKNEPSLLLSYFSFGIILTILGQLAALLMLLKKCWLLTLVIFIPSALNVHFLVVVYTLYEQMEKGTFAFRRHQDEYEDPLTECFDESVDI